MKITKELLKSWDACNEGYAWFVTNFDSDSNYSVVYAALVKAKEYGYAEWLSNKAFNWLVSYPYEIAGFVESEVAFTVSEAIAGENTSSGDGSMAASSGFGSKASSSGSGSAASSSGDYSMASSLGDGNMASSSGFGSTASSSGFGSKASSSGDYSTASSSGFGSKASSSGKSTVSMVAGLNGMAKAGENGAFALAWMDGKQMMRIAVGIVGENGIKADTFYSVSSGVLIEVKE